MAMYLNIRRVDRETTVIKFPKPVEVVSTLKVISARNSKPSTIEHAVFKHVEESFSVNNIVEYYREILVNLGIESGIVFLTAVPMDELLHIEGSSSEIAMTIGLEPPICIDSEKIYKSLEVGTINILIYVNLPLSREAMTDLLKTVTEAKAAASSDLLLRCRSRAVGTVTDAIAIAKPYDAEEKILFSGMATMVGNNIARVIYSSIVSVGTRKGIEWLLKSCTGYTIDDFLTVFKDVYMFAPLPNTAPDKAIERARKILYKVLRDPNVWSFIIAARELDLHGASGVLPGLSIDEYTSDSVKIVADELLGISLSLYIGGAKAMFSMYWVENLKKMGKLKYDGAGLYIDDIISALLGSLYTLLIEEMDTGGADG